MRPHFAVKANPDPRVLKVLIQEGAGFEIASIAELDVLMGLGVPVAEIFYSNPMKSRAYLEYAESGGTSLGTAVPEPPALTPFESDVRDRLLAAGVPVVARYGVAGYYVDFAAAHPDDPSRMVLAIETDGGMYRSSGTARDRDRLRQEHLQRPAGRSTPRRLAG